MVQVVDVAVDRLVTTGLHNAFTSLAVWNNHIYCTWREAQGHEPETPGTVVVWRTPYPYNPTKWVWEPAGRIHTGGDDRDPKLLAIDDTTLAVYFGTGVPQWGHIWKPRLNSIAVHLRNMQSHISFTRNGRDWGMPTQIGRINYWYWSIIPNPYATVPAWMGFAYHSGGMLDGMSIHVNVSDDLLNWRHWATIDDMPYGQFSEPVAWATGFQGMMHVLYRNGDSLPMHIGTSADTQEIWITEKTTHRIHPSAVLPLSKDTVLLTGRAMTLAAQEPKRRYDSSVKLWSLTLPGPHQDKLKVTELVTFPSGGDCGYAGLCWANNSRQVALCSYYSQHEETLWTRADPQTPLPLHQRWYPHRTGIYLAQVTLRGTGL